MFRIKICGIKTPADALLVQQAGADAIGLNFYPKSRRFISLETAKKIKHSVADSIDIVGLFVNAEISLIKQYHDHLQFDWVQLHGDEDPIYLSELNHALNSGNPPKRIRAFRTSEHWQNEVQQFIEVCGQLDVSIPAILIDAYQAGEYGGTGKSVDWKGLKDWQKNLNITNLILAGGLKPTNVQEAIQTVSPTAVDTASGVENQNGFKDPLLVEDFVNRATKVLTEL